MWEHHKKSIDNLIQILSPDERYLAVILSGSLAQGIGREHSDIDIYLVVSDEEYKRAVSEDDFCYYNSRVCTYEGGYIDGKVINLDYIYQAAEKGSEPTRLSFLGAKVLWSRVDNLQEVVDKIAIFCEAEREKKLEAFFSQVVTWGKFFYKESLKKDNLYLKQRSVTETVFFCCRYVLEYNRILFPCHKSLFTYLSQAKTMPRDFESHCKKAMQEQSPEAMEALLNSFFAFSDTNLSFQKAISVFMRDSEKNWLDGKPPVADC